MRENGKVALRASCGAENLVANWAANLAERTDALRSTIKELSCAE